MALPGLTLIIQTRALDRIHYALMLGVSNAALGGTTTLFFAVEGVQGLTRDALPDLETAAGEAGAAYLARVEAGGVALPDELFAALAELQARIAACDSGLAVAGLDAADLRQDIPVEITGLADILAGGKDARLVYV